MGQRQAALEGVVILALCGIGGLTANDRVLVLGGSGWFGRTLLSRIGSELPVLATASTVREGFIEWDERAISEFAPTVVVAFAFLTADRLQHVGESQFTDTNRTMIERFRIAASLNSVRAVMVASSGAAVTAPDTPYGRLKREEERVAQQLQGSARSVVILRSYSVSGPFVQRPEAYAFSDFIQQAKAGLVRVTATRPVYRRYVDVDDLLRVGLSLVLQGWSGVVESGGDLVEMGDLAQQVIEVVNPGAELVRASLETDESSVYASDDTSWQEACARTGIVPADLDEQIRRAAVGLVAHVGPVE